MNGVDWEVRMREFPRDVQSSQHVAGRFYRVGDSAKRCSDSSGSRGWTAPRGPAPGWGRDLHLSSSLTHAIRKWDALDVARGTVEAQARLTAGEWDQAVNEQPALHRSWNERTVFLIGLPYVARAVIVSSSGARGIIASVDRCGLPLCSRRSHANFRRSSCPPVAG